MFGTAAEYIAFSTILLVLPYSFVWGSNEYDTNLEQ